MTFKCRCRAGKPNPMQAVFIQVTERRPLKSLLPAVKTSCWEQLSCHPKQKYFRGGTSLPQNFGLDSSTLLIEKRVQVKIGLSHSKRFYYRYKEYFCSLSWHKSPGDISLFHNRSTFFQNPWVAAALHLLHRSCCSMMRAASSSFAEAPGAATRAAWYLNN